MKEYRTIQPFIAFGKCAAIGDKVELTDQQASDLSANIAPYETKVLPGPKKTAKKSLPLSQPAPASQKKTAKKRGKSAKK